MATGSAKMIHELVRLDPSAGIELFELDLTPLGDVVYRWFNGFNYKNESIVWQGNTYSALPIQVDGFETSTEAAPGRPRMTISNVMGIVGQLVDKHDGLMNMKVTRIRTRARFLDAVNFPEGNPEASGFELPRDVYFVRRKVSHTKTLVELELGAVTDVIATFPGRIVSAQTCIARYRESATCGYYGPALTDVSGHPFDVANLVPMGEWTDDAQYPANAEVYIYEYSIATVPEEHNRRVYFVSKTPNTDKYPPSHPDIWTPDVCPKMADAPGCRLRWPEGPMPFNGFPGIDNVSEY